MGLIVKIDELAILGKRLEAMRKPGRDQHRPCIPGAEDLPVPLQICGRIRPDIHGHIENRPGDAGNELCLLMRSALEVHAADRALLVRQRVVDLRNAKIVTESREFFPAEKPREIAALVLNGLPADGEQALQNRCLAAKTRHEGFPLCTVNEASAGLHGHAPFKSNARLVSMGCNMAKPGAVTKETTSIPVAGCAVATPITPAKPGAGERLLAGYGRHQGRTGATQRAEALLFVVHGSFRVWKVHNREQAGARAS